MANLRYPTLERLCGYMEKITCFGSAIVMSGIKTDESPFIVESYAKIGFDLVWQETEKDWGGLVLIRKLEYEGEVCP